MKLFSTVWNLSYPYETFPNSMKPVLPIWSLSHHYETYLTGTKLVSPVWNLSHQYNTYSHGGEKGQNGLFFFALRPKWRDNDKNCSLHDLAKIISMRISPSLSKMVDNFSNGGILLFINLKKKTHFGGSKGTSIFVVLKLNSECSNRILMQSNWKLKWFTFKRCLIYNVPTKIQWDVWL